MSVATFRSKVVPPSSGRQILFHMDAKVEGKKGFRLSHAAPVCSTDNASNTVCDNTFPSSTARSCLWTDGCWYSNFLYSLLYHVPYTVSYIFFKYPPRFDLELTPSTVTTLRPIQVTD